MCSSWGTCSMFAEWKGKGLTDISAEICKRRHTGDREMAKADLSVIPTKKRQEDTGGSLGITGRPISLKDEWPGPGSVRDPELMEGCPGKRRNNEWSDVAVHTFN